jgi:predicted acyltransferase
MVGMILVDNLGPVANPPWFLDHAQWHGLTPADLIFPAFLFIMGMAVPLAVSPTRPVRVRNVARILGLFAIGLLLNLIGKKFDFEVLRILGILQRLSLCYAAILLLHVLYGLRRKVPPPPGFSCSCSVSTSHTSPSCCPSTDRVLRVLSLII